MTSFLKMPKPAGWSPPAQPAQPEAKPVVVNVAQVRGGLFVAMQATGATIGKAPKKAENSVGTQVLPMPKNGITQP